MIKPLLDFVPAEFADRKAFHDAMNANMAAFLLPYGNHAGGQVWRSETAAGCVSGLPYFLFNGQAWFRQSEQCADDEIDRIHSALGPHPASWWIGETCTPADLAERLKRRGWGYCGSIPGMAMDLTMDSPPAQHGGLEIRIVESKADNEVWLRTLSKGTGFKIGLCEAIVLLENGFDTPLWSQQTRFLGFSNGLPVATSFYLNAGGLGGIYGVSTINEARGQGFGGAITQAAAEEARNQGNSTVVLQSSEMGFSVYKRLGFQWVCCYELWQSPEPGG